ncbi:MAG: hypothetical protein ACREU9_08460 [Gammaproteobacteria bacterium]
MGSAFDPAAHEDLMTRYVLGELAVVTQFPIPVDAYTAPVSRLIVTRERSDAPPEPP